MASVTINTTTETVVPALLGPSLEITSRHNSYSTARTGANLVGRNPPSGVFVGQFRPGSPFTFNILQLFYVFDTRNLRQGATYLAAEIRATAKAGTGQGDLQLRPRRPDPEIPFPTLAHDWLDPSSYGDLLATAEPPHPVGDIVWAGEGMIDEVDFEGFTWYCMISSQTVLGATPDASAFVAEVTNPELVLTHGAFIDVEIVETLGVSDEIELPAPTVTVTEPSAPVTSGGPTLTFEWDYESVLGVPQEQFRVVVTDGSETTTYYDSGWRIGNDNSWSIDAVARGIPTDTDDLAVTIEVRSTFADTPLEGSSGATAFEMQWGEVTLTVDSPTPGEEIATPQVTVEWTFQSTRSKTQGEWRVRLLAGSSSTVLYDSGWTEGTEDSFEVPFILTPGGSYRVGVQVRNSEGVPNG